MTIEEKQEIGDKINSEGFEYYFTSYGPDSRLDEICGTEIENFVKARNNLVSALLKNSIEVEY